jgi:hypothetical protein
VSAIRAENEPDDTFRREAGAGPVARRYATELLGCQRRTDADVLAYDHAGVAVQAGPVSITAASAFGVFTHIAYVPATPDALREHRSMTCEGDHPCRGGADSGGRRVS